MNFVKLVLSLSFESANEKQRYMTNSLQKSIKRLSIAILVIGGLTLAYTYFQMISQLWLHAVKSSPDPTSPSSAGRRS